MTTTSSASGPEIRIPGPRIVIERPTYVHHGVEPTELSRELSAYRLGLRDAGQHDHHDHTAHHREHQVSNERSGNPFPWLLFLIALLTVGAVFYTQHPPFRDFVDQQFGWKTTDTDRETRVPLSEKSERTTTPASDRDGATDTRSRHSDTTPRVVTPQRSHLPTPEQVARSVPHRTERIPVDCVETHWRAENSNRCVNIKWVDD